MASGNGNLQINKISSDIFCEGLICCCLQWLQVYLAELVAAIVECVKR